MNKAFPSGQPWFKQCVPNRSPAPELEPTPKQLARVCVSAGGRSRRPWSGQRPIAARGLKRRAQSLFLVHSVILGWGKSFAVAWLHWGKRQVACSESGLGEHVGVFVSAAVGMVVGTNRSAGDLGNYLENKSHGGKERSWGLFGHSCEDDLGAPPACSSPITHS